MNSSVGKYAFIVGVIIAVVLGLASESLGETKAWLWSLLVLLGLVVGFMNVSGKESKDFLWVTVSLAVVTFVANAQINSWSDIELVGIYLTGVFNSLMSFVVPATIVVALKVTWGLAKGQ